MDKRITSDTAISEKLTFRKETIEHKIDLYELRKNLTKNTQFLWGLFATLIVTLLSTDLEKMFTKEQSLAQWMLLLISISIGSITAWKTANIRKMRDPIIDLKKSLYDSYINKPDLNVLFIIKRTCEGNKQILVMRNKAWGCYFLPYIGIRKSVDDIIAHSNRKIENILGLTKDSTTSTMLLEHHEKTEKHHPQENVVKEYHSYYVHLANNGTNEELNILLSNSFDRGNLQFEWKTFTEIESDKKTKEKNSDVLKVIREHYNDFIESTQNFQDD